MAEDCVYLVPLVTGGFCDYLLTGTYWGLAGGVYTCPKCGANVPVGSHHECPTGAVTYFQVIGPEVIPLGFYFCQGCARLVSSGLPHDCPATIQYMAAGTTPHKCPVCNGTGLVGIPPGVAGDRQEFVTSEPGPWPCRACDGKGVLWR